MRITPHNHQGEDVNLNTEQQRIAKYTAGWNDAMMKRAPAHPDDIDYARGRFDARRRSMNHD